MIVITPLRPVWEGLLQPGGRNKASRPLISVRKGHLRVLFRGSVLPVAGFWLTGKADEGFGLGVTTLPDDERMCRCRLRELTPKAGTSDRLIGDRDVAIYVRIFLGGKVEELERGFSDDPLVTYERLDHVGIVVARA